MNTATIRTLDNRQLAIVSTRTLNSFGFNRGHWVADVIAEEFTCEPDAVGMDYARDGMSEEITIRGQHVANLFFA